MKIIIILPYSVARFNRYELSLKQIAVKCGLSSGQLWFSPA